MKKIFMMLTAVVAVFALASCNGGGKGAEDIEALKGNVMECDKFSMNVPKSMKETYKSDIAFNVSNEDEETKMDATFSDYPCKPEDFEKYAQGLTGMEMFSLYKFDKPVIDGNIMTIKGVNGDRVMNQFVVYLGEKAGVAGKVEYPVAKAAEMEELLGPMLKSIKQKQ